MKPYTHFTLNERKYLQESLETGDSIRKIAKALRRSPSTISREIKRNWSKKSNHYHHWAAQIKYWERRKSCHRKNNLLKDNAAYAFALEKLHQFWSPEIIAGNWNLNHDKKTSYSSIYRAVYAGIKPGTYLRRRGKPYSIGRKSYTHYMDRSIHDRGKEADLRMRFGDYEGDTIYGSVGIEKDLNLKVYFADPHSPWQRGSNENVNDVFRFFFPRGFDFRTLSRERLDAVLDLINNRPRKCLDFISPVDFFNKTVALGLTI